MPQRRPRFGRVRRAGRAFGRVARAAGRRSKPHLPILGLGVAAAAVGWADSKGWTSKIPTIGGSRALTLAIAGYAATRLTSNKHVRMAGVAAVCAGGFDWGKVQGGGTSGIDDETSGDEGY